MAITRVGSESIDLSTASLSTHTLSHTVPSGCDFLLVCAGAKANSSLFSNPDWNAEELTLISQTTSSGTNADSTNYVYGLVSPTPATGNLVWTWANAQDASWVACINYAGTETSSVGAASNAISEDVDDAGSGTTSVLSSGGLGGNSLILVGNGVGDDQTPASNNASFTEIYDTDTGGGASSNQDFSVYIAELLDSAPSAVTITWGAVDERAAQTIELVAATTGGLPGYNASNRGILRGVGRGIG